MAMQLAAWMAEEGLTNVALAGRLGVATNTVNRWRNKWRRPRPEIMAALHTISGGRVTPNDFFIGAAHPLPVDQRPVQLTDRGSGQ